jgi:deazaflavin-dependent oxidoreductase (nitroreductase family)
MSDHEQTYDVSSLPAEGTEEYRSLARDLIAEFRANGGKVGGPLTGVPLLVLRTTGAKSGLARENLVAYTTDNVRIIVVAAKENDVPRHPDWFYNLRAHPDVTVESGTETFPARAMILEGAERRRLLDQFAAEIPPEFAVYLHKTHVETPVIALDRVG